MEKERKEKSASAKLEELLGFGRFQFFQVIDTFIAEVCYFPVIARYGYFHPSSASLAP